MKLWRKLPRVLLDAKGEIVAVGRQKKQLTAGYIAMAKAPYPLLEKMMEKLNETK